MKLHMLSGIPGSGKSTISKRLSGNLVSTDAIRKLLWGDESIVAHDKLVFQIVEDALNYELSSEMDVIFDATNLTTEIRKKYINLAKSYDASVVVHWIDCPLETALDRNRKRDRNVPEHIIRALHGKLQPPLIHEGMDVINIYGENLKLSRTVTPSVNRSFDFW